MYKVLIVDDNIEDRNGLLNHIPWKSLNCSVTTADDGQEGLESALDLKPDIIITDISMPVMNGIEMTKEIDKLLSDVHFIYMSCFDDFDYAVSGIEYGISAYILKPINIDEMVENVIKITSKIEEHKKSKKVLSEFKKRVEESRGILAERFLTNALMGVSNDVQIVNNQAKYLDIDITTKYRMIIFQSEYSPDIDNTQSAYTSLFMLRNLIAEHILSDYQGYCINYDYSILALILKDNSINTDDIILKFYELQESFLNNTQKTVTICMSNFAYYLHELCYEFKKLLNIVRYEHFSKNGSVIMSDEIDSGQYELKSVIANEISSEISALFSSDDNTKIDKFIDKYYPDSAKSGEIYAKALSFHIINTVNILLIEQNENFANIFDSEISIWEKLINYRTISNIKQWLKNILIITKKHLNDKTNDNYNKIISDIKKNIDENFATLQTLDQIVENLFISPGYANKLFHEHTNQTIFDYLLDKRISEAKSLLKNKNLKSYEIAEMVGYRSNTYFTTAFKKYTGVTPKEYRSTLEIA